MKKDKKKIVIKSVYITNFLIFPYSLFRFKRQTFLQHRRVKGRKSRFDIFRYMQMYTWEKSHFYKLVDLPSSALLFYSKLTFLFSSLQINFSFIFYYFI